MSTQIHKPRSNRLISLDALRGFDMFWIVGGEGIFHTWAKHTDSGIIKTIDSQLHHAAWHGFTFYDLIFPLFLFIAGVSMPFSFASRQRKGQTKTDLYKHILTRGIVLVILGVIYNGFFDFDFANMRFASVLGRIGLGWMFAAFIVMNTKIRGQILWFAGILIFYWAIMKLVPVPGHGPGVLTQEGSLAGWFDRIFCPGTLYRGNHDPEGILSTLPAISTALLGVLTGHFLRWKSDTLSKHKKGLYILAAGLIFLGVAQLWNLVFPINKNLWTSSFVMQTGGWSLLLLGVFYFIVDVFGFKKWAFPFIIIGLNPITIYMASSGIINFRSTAEYFFAGALSYTPEGFRAVMMAVCVIFVKWLFLYFLYKRKIFLRV